MTNVRRQRRFEFFVSLDSARVQIFADFCRKVFSNIWQGLEISCLSEIGNGRFQMGQCVGGSCVGTNPVRIISLFP